MSEQNLMFDFSNLEPIRIPVIGPDKVRYVLVEASGAAAKKYNNARASSVTLGPDGKTQRIDNIGDLEPLLVSLCLQAEDGKPIHQAAIEKWPAHVIKQLFNKAKEISRLDESTENPYKPALTAALNHGKSPVTLQAFKNTWYPIARESSMTRSRSYWRRTPRETD